MVSMRDIAQRCNVSVATVSKALNGQPDISEETRQRIRSVADEMGYLVNSAARALKTNRTYNLGVLFVDAQQSGLTHEYFSSILESFKVEAEAHGYDITFISNQNTGSRNSSYLDHAHYRGVDGVVIACVDFNDPQVIELLQSDLPVVTIDYVFNNRMAVLSNNVDGPEKLVRHIYQCGHRKIAFIHGERTAVTEKRLTSFYRTCEVLGLEIPDEYVRESRYHDPNRCAQLTKELLALPVPPTCILFPDDFSSIGGLRAISETGLQVPDDISVVGYDGIYLSRVLTPMLTTYKQNTTALGKTAADRLIRLIEHPQTTLCDHIVIDGHFLEGDSVGIVRP